MSGRIRNGIFQGGKFKIEKVCMHPDFQYAHVEWVGILAALLGGNLENEKVSRKTKKSQERYFGEENRKRVYLLMSCA